MSFALAITVAAQASVELAPPPSVTASDMTLPVSIYDCELADVRGEHRSFSIEIRGWRAFETESGIFHTDSTVRVLKDPAKIFRGYVLDTFDGQEFRGVANSGSGTFGHAFQAKIRQADQTLSNEFKGRVLMTIGEFREPRRGVDPYYTNVGFCDVVRTPQIPLSDDEVAEFTKQ